jgi:hypothetical protein
MNFPKAARMAGLGPTAAIATNATWRSVPHNEKSISFDEEYAVI